MTTLTNWILILVFGPVALIIGGHIVMFVMIAAFYAVAALMALIAAVVSAPFVGIELLFKAVKKRFI